MNEYILFMHDDAVDTAIANDGAGWEQYIAGLRASGYFDGGSSIGPGMQFNKRDAGQAASTQINGYIRIRAENLNAAQRFLIGNPIFEAGGTVEIRRLEQS